MQPMIPHGDELAQAEQKPVNALMIQLAREARGLSQEALATALGVSQGRVSKIEKDLLFVSDELLDKLCEVLLFPPHFFTQDDAILGPEIAEVFHRKRNDVPVKLLHKIYARMEIFRRQVASLLQSTELPENLRRMDVDEYDGRVTLVAQLVRASFRLPRGPIQDLTKTLEDAGVIIVSMDFETNKIDAIARWVPGMPPLIFVNKRTPKDRYRFSLAHELAHLVMHRHPTPDIEREANEFAAEFLMPEQDIRADLRDLTIAKLAQLKRHWKASMASLLRRAKDLGAITPSRAETLVIEMSRRGYTKHEPIELDPRSERPLLLHELVAIHLKRLRYTEDELAHALRITTDELRSEYMRGLAGPVLKVVHTFG